MQTDERDLASNLRIAATLLRHGHILELGQSAYAGFQAADTNREKLQAVIPLLLALAEVSDELSGKSLPRDFDASRDYVGELERKFTLRTVLSFVVRMAGMASDWQTFLDDLAGK
jgi:hypothetical protein